MLPSLIPLPPATFRACELCDHGPRGHVDGQGHCACPALATERDRRIAALRAAGGGCGPEAKFLDFPGLHSGRRAA